MQGRGAPLWRMRPNCWNQASSVEQQQQQQQTEKHLVHSHNSLFEQLHFLASFSGSGGSSSGGGGSGRGSSALTVQTHQCGGVHLGCLEHLDLAYEGVAERVDALALLLDLLADCFGDELVDKVLQLG